MKRITFVGPINSYTGYGLHSLQIIRDIERLAGAYVSVRTLSKSEAFGAKVPVDISGRFVLQPQPEDWEVLLHPPDFLPTPGKKTAYFTMWETTKLPPQCATLINKANVTIVPCHWNATILSACGVTTPIRVVPLGVHEKIFHWKRYPEEDAPFTFGAAGRMAHGGVRKGINEVIEAFRKAFPPSVTNVRLKIKCFPDCPVHKIPDSRIEITQAYLSDEQMADWYASLNVFVSAARGEGWGLMQHQAMACGRPVMSVNFGGVTEFFDPELGFSLPFDYELAGGSYKGCGHWAVAREKDMIQLMRDAVEMDRNTHINKGMFAALAVKHLTWDNHSRQLVKVLEEFGAL